MDEFERTDALLADFYKVIKEKEEHKWDDLVEFLKKNLRLSVTSYWDDSYRVQIKLRDELLTEDWIHLPQDLERTHKGDW